MASTAFTMNPAVVKNLPYDPIKDFDWVATFGKAPVVITVGPAAPVNSLQELLALGKSKPNYITMASAGGFMHFVSAMFRSHAGFKGEIALYKGGAPAMIDVMSGQTHMAVATIPTANPHLRSGKVKALAVGPESGLRACPTYPPRSKRDYRATRRTSGGHGRLRRALRTRLSTVEHRDCGDTRFCPKPQSVCR